MFQFLQTWDGVRVAKFGVEHIGYIRKAMLYSWLTSRKCSLDLTSLLIFADKGCFSELLYFPNLFFVYCMLRASELHCYRNVRYIVIDKWAALFLTSGLHPLL